VRARQQTRRMNPHALDPFVHNRAVRRRKEFRAAMRRTRWAIRRLGLAFEAVGVAAQGASVALRALTKTSTSAAESLGWKELGS
jgi:hypothetical protein